jgi:hypothetical protein
MKLFAARVENDADDIAFLCRQLGLTTVEQGPDLVEEVSSGVGHPVAVLQDSELCP